MRRDGNDRGGRGPGKGRQRRGGFGRRKRMMGFLQPCLLLQLVEKDLHGYDLLQGLDRFMSDGTAYDPSVIYRLLKAMETDGLVSSYEGELSRGPRRKMYTLSAAGWSQLRYWRDELEKTRKEVELVLALYEKIVDRADPYRTGG